MTYIQQLDITDCGAACLGMIASHFGRSLNITQIRQAAGTDVVGTNINGMITAAQSYGLKATAVKGVPSAITPKLDCPFIVHFHIVRDEENWVDHYVVVKRIGKKYIEIWDPDPLYKKQKLTYEQFFKWWTGCP